MTGAGESLVLLVVNVFIERQPCVKAIKKSFHQLCEFCCYCGLLCKFKGALPCQKKPECPPFEAQELGLANGWSADKDLWIPAPFSQTQWILSWSEDMHLFNICACFCTALTSCLCCSCPRRTHSCKLPHSSGKGSACQAVWLRVVFYGKHFSSVVYA